MFGVMAYILIKPELNMILDKTLSDRSKKNKLSLFVVHSVISKLITLFIWCLFRTNIFLTTNRTTTLMISMFVIA